MTLLNLFFQGGVLMYVLLLISILVISIVIDKYRLIRLVNVAQDKLKGELFASKNLGSLSELASENAQSSPLAVMLAKMLSLGTDEFALVKESLESTANMELHKLEKGMGWLSTFAAVAPLIGFLGTVIGMVRVFMDIQTQSQSGVDINLLAGGIWEAMLTTIGGLIVGIIAIVLYNDLIQKLEAIAKDLSDCVIQLIIKKKELGA